MTPRTSPPLSDPALIRPLSVERRETSGVSRYARIEAMAGVAAATPGSERRRYHRQFIATTPAETQPTPVLPHSTTRMRLTAAAVGTERGLPDEHQYLLRSIRLVVLPVIVPFI